MTNHTDKELLELAAKAAGLVGIHERANKFCYTSSHGHGGSVMWNPLESDGDALRLAVNLGMELDIDIVSCTATYKSGGYFNLTEVDDNPYAATRRAIVRAAAAIGEKL